MAVYDEKCMTQYPAKCVKEQTCTMVYRTMCEMEGYSQNCKQMPSESCVPVTKCHRIPKTQCKPIKEKECGDVQVQVPVRQMVYKCQPFEPRQEENLDACMGMMQGNDMFAPPPGSSYGPPGGVTPSYGGSNPTTSFQLPLTQQPNNQQSSNYGGANPSTSFQLPLKQQNNNQQSSFNVDPGLTVPALNSYGSTQQQVPTGNSLSAPSQNFNSGLSSQPVPNTYTSSQNLNAPNTQNNFAQTSYNNNNGHNNALQSTYVGSQIQVQNQPQTLPSPSNYNSGSSTFGQQQNNIIGSTSNQQTLNSYGPSGFIQTPVGNSYSSTNNGLLTPQVQLQQPFINGNSKPVQSFSAPSSYASPLTSNYAIQTPFAPAINSNSNQQGKYLKN